MRDVVQKTGRFDAVAGSRRIDLHAWVVDDVLLERIFRRLLLRARIGELHVQEVDAGLGVVLFELHLLVAQHIHSGLDEGHAG